MKKVLAILTAAVALGSSILTAPANAVEQQVNVQVTVDPVIYLRTFKTIDLRITQGNLGGTDGDQIQETTDGSTLIDRTPPEALTTGGATSVEKDVNELFAVWGNTGTSVQVTVVPVEGSDTLTNGATGTALRKAKVTVGSYIGNSTGALGPETPVVGGVKLSFAFMNSTDSATKPTAGVYTGGKIKVIAVPGI
ncbi:hypothetical protein F7734_50795 [Scytonema sp. UIC 10036]|uniref:hypothetical protein n=1 Tax=Scytonema sp. UIC 10036 TaxID=2304196 RepID=UPI0012DA163F|nr:hypothetical protein [Scytonema sp. UIC 10036]MUH00126.1 hypothetical protein [Scytonema sp. UIC 10036]